MPVAKLKILSVSSESEIYRASNLLEENGNCWITAKPEPIATLVVELEKPSKITRLDIGNNNSAIMTVLVGNSLESETNFHEILPTSSLMTQYDSVKFLHRSRVYCFGPEMLQSSIASQYWQILIFVCSQPYNTHVSYGLAFIKVHILDAIPQLPLSSPMKEKCQNDFVSKANEFVMRLKQTYGNTNWNVIEATWTDLLDLTSTTIENQEPTPNLVSSNNITGQNISKKRKIPIREQILKKMSKSYLQPKKNYKKKNLQIQEPKENVVKGNDYNKLNISHVTPLRILQDTTNPQRILQDAPTPTYAPFNKLLTGVTFVMSGIQNPARSDIRKKAIALGACYESEWTNNCTHLICAFENTSKYSDAKGNGKIITRKWIEDCYTMRKYLPWRKYALNNEERAENPSDDEIWDVALRGKQPESTKITEKEIGVGSNRRSKKRAASDSSNNTGQTAQPKKLGSGILEPFSFF